MLAGSVKLGEMAAQCTPGRWLARPQAAARDRVCLLGIQLRRDAMLGVRRANQHAGRQVNSPGHARTRAVYTGVRSICLRQPATTCGPGATPPPDPAPARAPIGLLQDCGPDPAGPYVRILFTRNWLPLQRL